MRPENFKTIGASYFAVLGLVNAGMTIHDNIFGFSDALLVAVSFVPLCFNRKGLLICFGFLAAGFAAIIGISCLMFQMNPVVKTPAPDFIMGYLLSASMLVASFLIVYAGMHLNNKTFSLI